MSTRRLAAVLFADIVGYTVMMQQNEAEGMAKAQRFREELPQLVQAHQGEVIEIRGDGALCLFNSAAEATACAQQIQQQLGQGIPLRIGIHLGDVMQHSDHIMGDAVNIASRIESMGVAGAVLLSSSIRQQIKNKPEFELVSLGKFAFKNVAEPMTVYALGNAGMVVPKAEQMKGKGDRLDLSTKRLVQLVSIGFVAMALGAAIFWATGMGSTRNSQLLDQNIHEARVGALPFENITGDASLDVLGRRGAELIISGLQTMKISTLTRETVEQHKSKLGILPNDPDGQPSFAEITGAQYVVMGSYYLVGGGDSLVLNTHVSSTETGEQIYSFPAVKVHVNHKEQLIQEARQYILGYWGTKAEEKIPDINPPKYDAYKVILECGSWSVECFYKALSIDPNFLFARIRLMGSCTSNSNDSLFYACKAIVEKNLDRLTEYERAMFDMYSHAWEGDRTEKIKSIKQLYQVDTNNWIALQWLGYNLLADNASYEAAEKYTKMFENEELGEQQTGGFQLSYTNFIEAHIKIQEYKKASDFYLNLPKVQKAEADDWGALDYVIQALIYQNRISEVHELIEENGAKEIFLKTAYAYNYIFPDKKNPFFKGLRERTGEFEDVFSQNIWLDSHVFNWNSKAMAYYVLKDWKNAEKSLVQRTDLLNLQFDQPFKQLPEPNYWKKLWHTSMLGSVYAHLGKLEAYQAQIDQLDHLRKLYPKTNSFYHRGVVPYLKARIVSVSGDKELAIELLTTSIKEGMLFVDWKFHFDQDFIPLKGYPPFEELIRPKG